MAPTCHIPQLAGNRIATRFRASYRKLSDLTIFAHAVTLVAVRVSRAELDEPVTLPSVLRERSWTVSPVLLAPPILSPVLLSRGRRATGDG